MIDLFFLDQSGFAPTLPTGFTWGQRGRRVVVPYQAPQGRRVNVVGAFAPNDPTGPRLLFETRRKAEGRYDAAVHLAFVRRVAGLTERATAAAAGVTFFYLPPYSPELNPIEPVWRQVKYQDMPERSYPTDVALQTAVEAALSRRVQRLESKSNLPRHA